MGAGLCPSCGRSVAEAGFLCDRCHDDEVARARPAESPTATLRQLARVRKPDSCQVPDGAEGDVLRRASQACPCALHDLIRASRRQLENAADRRPTLCLVEGRSLPYSEWADLVDRCSCPLHAKPPTLTVVPKGAA